MSTETKRSDTTPERYVHIEFKNHPRFHHGTLFARQLPNGDWQYSVSLCVHGDQFNREVGRKVARRKYFNGKRFPFRMDNPKNFYNCAEHYLASHADA